MVDRTMASRSSSDEADFNLFRKLARASRTVSAEVAFDNRAVVCVIVGVFSATNEDFTVVGAGSLTVEVNSVDISSCRFDEALCDPPFYGGCCD
jgi:hypothetical protein